MSNNNNNIFTTKPGASDGLELGVPLGGGQTNLSGGGGGQTNFLGGGGGQTNLSGGSGFNSSSDFDNSSSNLGGSTTRSGANYGNALDGTDNTGTGTGGLRSGSGYDDVADTPAGIQAGMGVGHHDQGAVHGSSLSGSSGLDNSGSRGYGSSALGGAGVGASSTPIADQFSSNTPTGPIGGEPVGSHSGLKEYDDQNLTTPGTGTGIGSRSTGSNLNSTSTGLDSTNSQQHRGAGIGLAAIGGGSAAYGADRAFNERDSSRTSTTGGGLTGGLTGDGYGGQVAGQTGDNSTSDFTTGTSGLNRTGDQYSTGGNTTTTTETGYGRDAALGAGAAGAVGAGSTGGATRDGIATHGTHDDPNALKEELKDNQNDGTSANHPESKGPHGLVWHNGKYVHQRELDLHGSTGVPLEKAFENRDTQ